MDVGDFLRKLGLQQYEAAFRDNRVDTRVLPKLTAEDLKDLGVATVGDRRLLLGAIAALSEAGAPAVKVGADALGVVPLVTKAPSTAQAERRPLSVMFCDLIGSTALSARLDPEDLREVIRAYQACVVATIQQFEGFIARYVGDGVLIYFGWPEAGETDAERAVRAGLAVAAAVSAAPLGGERLQVRVGIATGLVVVGEPIGSGDSRQQTAVGETPNLAARLQGLAGPGQVVIDAATHRQIGGLFGCQDLGTVKLKGLSVVVPAWLVLGEGILESRFQALRSGATPLVGRDEELELLLRRWVQAKGGSGRVVLISAEPGVGKSRLAEVLVERIGTEPHTRLRYFCSPHHQDSALYPVIAQMERAADFLHADAPAERLIKLQTLLAPTTPPMEDVAMIADLHSLPSAGLAPPLDATPQRKKEKTFEALQRQVEGLSRQNPVLMIFDDLHWIDPSSREFLDRLIERVADWPVLLLAIFRPEFQPPWIGQPHVTTLTLTRLDRRDTEAMVANVAGNAALPAEIVEEIAERTDGVPLFVEELTKAVLESGPPGTAALSSVPHLGLSVPATLHASLMARLDRLGPIAKDVAQAGAAIGREFGHRLLTAVIDLPEPHLSGTLDRLSNAGLLFVRGTPPESTYIFKHALVQDAAYGTLLRGRRQRLHSRIAASLEDRFPEIVAGQPARLAQHCEEAGLTEKSVAYWLAAGRQSWARSMSAEVIALFRRGLAQVHRLPESEWRQEHELALQVGLARALIAIHGWTTVELGEAYARARQLAVSLNRSHEILFALQGEFQYHICRADLNRARQVAADMRVQGETSGDVFAQVLAYDASADVCYEFGEFLSARAHAEKGVALYDPAHRALYAELMPNDMLLQLLDHSSIPLACLGYIDQALSRVDAALAEARRSPHPFNLGLALFFRFLAGWLVRSEPQWLLPFADEMLALSTEHELGLFRAGALCQRGWCLAALGNPDEGVTLITSGLSLGHGVGFMLNTPMTLTLLADAHRMAGQLQHALENVAAAQGLADQSHERMVQAETLRLRGDLQILARDQLAAEASFCDAIALAERQSAKLFQLRASVSLAQLWRDQGKQAEARDLLVPIYHWFTEGFDAPDLKDAKALLDELHEHRF
jgi:class 3 adenylate cyclase/tetratricopeptide (TPR) repeat protein